MATLLQFFISNLLLYLAICSTSAPSSSQVQTELDEFLAKHGPIEHFSATVFSYKPPGDSPIRTFSSGTFGMDSKKPINDETLFGWGSLTKEFITSLLMAQEKSGKFRLTATLEEYFPEYFTEISGADMFVGKWPEDWKSVTMLQMLTMTSGLMDFNEGMFIMDAMNLLPQPYLKFVADHQYSPEEIVAVSSFFTRSYPIACRLLGSCFTPGATYKYSNTNYFLAGMLVEKIYGQSVESLLSEHVSAKMSPDSHFFLYFADSVLPKDIFDQLPSGVTRTFIDPAFQNVTDIPWNFEGYAGGLIGDSASLIQAMELLWENGINGGLPATQWGNYVLKETGKFVSSVKECVDAGCYGLGTQAMWNDDLGAVFWYEGEPYGYRTAFYYIPCYDLWFTMSVNSGVNGYHTLPAFISQLGHQLFDQTQLTQVGGDEFCSVTSQGGNSSNAKVDFLVQFEVSSNLVEASRRTSLSSLFLPVGVSEMAFENLFSW